jgi:hypothetical protein
MAGLLALHSVGRSLVRLLDRTFPGTFDPNEVQCAFRLVSSGELTAAATQELNNTLTLYLYRVTMDRHLRNAASPGLAVDLHFLMTVWSNSALTEHAVMAWAMRQFHENSVLDRSVLSDDGAWQRYDTVQLIPAELTHEDLMRIWDSIEPAYRLSASYIARVVHIDPERPDRDFGPVVASRFGYSPTTEEER